MKRITFVMIISCLITMTVFDRETDARDITLETKRCGSAKIDSTDLSNNPGITIHSFCEKGALISAEPTPLPGLWENIKYSCYGYIVELSISTGKYKWANGICQFKDKNGDSIISTVNSFNNKVELQFKNGTGNWSGISGTGEGHGEMPFSREGIPRQCSSLSIMIRVP